MKMLRIMAGVKICGISSFDIYQACAAAGAAFVGMVFYPPSPRHLELAAAEMLAEQADSHIPPDIRPQRVALCVDASDDELAAIVARARPDMLQLHGRETPQRIRAVRHRFALPVMAVVKVGDKSDITRSKPVQEAADWILFDAAPQKAVNALPGGTGEQFDWSVLDALQLSRPWMLAGGLTVQNVSTALATTRAPYVDVSSGVEKKRGEKSKSAISAFVKAAKLG